MGDAAPAVFVAFALIGSGVTWQAVRTAGVPVNSPDRLVAELRLAQIAALLLVLSAGAYIGLAVASQIPCRFCVIAHTEFAKLNGATDTEIKEAIGMASLTRELSTLLNGMQVDEAQFRHDVDRLVKGAKAAAKKNAATAQR